MSTAELSAVLLDTCAVLWLARKEPMAKAALAAIQDAAAGDGVYVSVASAWEIGMLCRPRAGRGPALTLLPDPKSWFQRFCRARCMEIRGTG